MTLTEELKKLIPADNQETRSRNSQLDVADNIEKVLEDIGMPLQPKFEIPLSKKLAEVKR